MRNKNNVIDPEQSLHVSTPAYTLFDADAVGLATIFGSPVAGSSLMALNYRQLGQTRKAVTTLLLGIAVTGLAILLGWNSRALYLLLLPLSCYLQ